jgi:hypothetical protein
MSFWYFISLLAQVYSREFTVSGHSSGGFFASQVQVAHSETVTGVGISGGGPYGCSGGSIIGFGTVCTNYPGLLNLNKIIAKAEEASKLGLIDDLKYLSDSNVYLFSGTLDTIVLPGSVKNNEVFYRHFIKDSSLITTNYNIPAGHGFISNDYGNACSYQGKPWINNCNFDLAGAMLTKLLGELKPKVPQILSNIKSFDQSEYTLDTWVAGLGENGWAYVPEYCSNNECPIHLHFHGCGQSYDSIESVYFTNAGFNQWAEANNIIIIYPQTHVRFDNDNGCWDNWGYTGSGYLYKSGLQIEATYKMAQHPPLVNWSTQ